MNKPEILDIDQLLAMDLTNSAVWVTKRFSGLAGETFAVPVFVYPDTPNANLKNLIVIGGGTLIDYAKAWRVENSADTKLIAIPSIWGSGSENSPISVINSDGKKIFKIGPQLMPDARVVWDKLSEGLPENLITYACADVWAHAIEGFLSPLATPNLRGEIAGLIKEMITLPVSNNLKWFDFSARACFLQSKSGVGFVHGIAHNLEVMIEGNRFGHSNLCAVYLYPVMRFNLHFSPKPKAVFDEYNIDTDAIMAILKSFFDETLFNETINVLRDNWKTILKDPLTRINCVLARPDYLSYFLNKEFMA